MLTTHAKRASALAVITLWLAACGGGLEVLVIPLFEFGFTGANNTTLFFQPDKPTQSSGNFDVDGVRLTVTGVTTVYNGTYNGCSFNLIPNAASAPNSPSYTGRFTNKDTIDLTLSAGVGPTPLTVNRLQPIPGRVTADFGC